MTGSVYAQKDQSFPSIILCTRKLDANFLRHVSTVLTEWTHVAPTSKKGHLNKEELILSDLHSLTVYGSSRFIDHGGERPGGS